MPEQCNLAGGRPRAECSGRSSSPVTSASGGQSPVVDHERIADAPHGLEVRDVPGDQVAVVHERRRSHQWIRATNRAARAFKIGVDASRQRRDLGVDRDDVERGEPQQELNDGRLASQLVQALDDPSMTVTVQTVRSPRSA